MPAPRPGGEIPLSIPDLSNVLPQSEKVVADMIGVMRQDTPTPYQIGARTSGLLEATRVPQLRRVVRELVRAEPDEEQVINTGGYSVGFDIEGHGRRRTVNLDIRRPGGPFDTRYTRVSSLDAPSSEHVYHTWRDDNQELHHISVARWGAEPSDDPDRRQDTFLVREIVPARVEAGDLVHGRAVTLRFRLDGDGFTPRVASPMSYEEKRFTDNVGTNRMMPEPEHPFK